MEDDYYKVLEISRNASQDEIKKAYHKLARMYHPNKNKEPGAEERMMDITRAYSNLIKKKRLDGGDSDGEWDELGDMDGGGNDEHSDSSWNSRTASRTSSNSQYRLGRTFIDYLSQDDAKRIQELAFIDLTVIFDEHNLSYSPRKAPKWRLLTSASVADSAVFGCALTRLIERDRQRQPGATVPLLLERVLSHLEQRCLHEEGLLRVSGQQQNVAQLRRTVDERFYSRRGDVNEALRTSSVNDVAALVKLFLRELPAPLLTHKLMDAFHQTDALPVGQQVVALNLLCLQLPETNRAVLRRLLDFLAAVATRETANKMTLENVAMIMAPNLMWLAQRRQKDISVVSEYTAATMRVVRNLIRHRDGLWEVLPKFISQVRKEHEAKQQLEAKKDHSRQECEARRATQPPRP